MFMDYNGLNQFSIAEIFLFIKELKLQNFFYYI